MCEQTPLHYKHGDIVWVKMGICWWPGEVIEFEKLPEDIRSSFKKGTKLPLVTVTFFQEDNYEYIKNLSNIYVYNCSKKDDFIKKGMDLIRAKNAFMEKFPSDIRIAEEKTNGNVDILDDPKYGPDNKQEFLTVVSQVFGSPTKKRISLGKGKRKSSINSKTPSSTKKNTGRLERNVTHPRFLGISNDHVVRVLIQTEAQHTREGRDEKTYYCQTCDFSSTRINVIVLHNQSHLQGNYTPTTSKKGTRSPNKKPAKKSFKIPLSKTSTIDEDLALLKSGIALSDADTETDEDDDKPKPKNKRKKKGAGDKAQGKKSKVEQKVEKKDIRVDLLKEWDDDEDEEVEASVAEEQSKTEPSSSKKEESTCFDFNDDDEKEIITTAAAGRKIPRVIPDKRKSTEPTEDANLPTAENDVNRTDQIEKNDTTEKPLDVDAFNDILEATKVPELPEVPQSLKCEQNFHSTRTIKFPDKPLDSPGPEVHIKKRFVKSFEDFEMSLKLIREKEEIEKREKANNESAIEDTNIPDEESLKPAINNGQELNQSETNEKHTDSSSELKVIETVEPEIIETPKESKDEVSEENQNTNDNYTIKRNLRGSQSKSRSKSPLTTEDEAKTRRKKPDSEKSLHEKSEDTTIMSSTIDDSSTTSKTEEIPVTDKNLESEKEDTSEINISKTEEVSQPLENTTHLEEKHDLEKKSEIENVPVEKIKRETRRSRRTQSSLFEKVEVEIKVDKHKDSISIEAVTLPVEEVKDAELSEPMKTSNDSEDNQVSEEQPRDTVQEPALESVKSPLIEEPVEKRKSPLIEAPVEKSDDLEKISKKSHERTSSRRKKSTDKYDSFEERFSKRNKSTIEKIHEKHDNDEIKKRTLIDLFEKPSKSKQHDVFDEPSRSRKHDKSEEPLKSKKHEHLEEPSKSKRRDNLDESSKSKRHDNSVESSKTIKHDKLEEPSKSKKDENLEEQSKSKRQEPSKSKKDENLEEQSKSKRQEPAKSKRHDNLEEPSKSIKHSNLEEPSKPKKDESLEEPTKSKRHEDDKTLKVDESKRRKLSEFDFERSYKSKSKPSHKDEEKKIEIESDHSSKKTLSRMHSSDDLQNKKLKTHEEDTTESKYENRRDKYYKSSKKLRPHKQEVTVANIETEVESKMAEVETKSGLKVSKLKSQLMNKLNDPEAESEPRPTTRTRSYSKSELDVTEDTENKHQSKRPRRFSLHTEEIVIEKSVDKVEVTIHNEETESQNLEPAEETPKEEIEIEVELSLPEKQVQLEHVEAEVKTNENNEIESDKQNETIVEAAENKEVEVPEVIEAALASVEEIIESKLEESIEMPPIEIDNKLLETKPSYDEMAAVNTLASISEMRNFGMVPSEHEINIEKNVTVVSESDLADGQVEIAKMPIIEEGTVKATTTITSFSVDFTGDMDMPKSEETAEKVCVIIPEKPQAKVEEKSVPEETIPKEVEAEISENVPEVTVEMEMAKLTDTNIETTVAPQPQEGTTSTKLLEILTDAKVRRSQQEQALKAAPRIQPNLKISNPKFNLETREQIVKPKGKVLIRSAIPGTSKTIRPVILSEKKLNSSLKDGNSIALQKGTAKDPESGSLVSVQKVCSKRSDDIEDIDTFIIKKPLSNKKSEDEEIESPKLLKKVIKPPKTKILEHAILKPATKEVQASTVKADDNVFDIDSMPIVLSDQILTPESLENMPIMIQQENAQNTPKPVPQIRKIQPQQQMKLLNKSPSPIIKQTIRGIVPSKTPMKQIKTGKVLTSTSTLMKHNPSIITQSKGSKFVIVTSVPSTPTVNKYTVGKRQFIKKNPAVLTGSPNKVLQGVSQDAQGNKIMIVTNNKGQQQQVVLTPTSQKLIPHSATKKIYKGTVQKDVTKSPNIISQTIINSKGQITTTNPSVFTSSSSISKKPRIEPTSKNKILGQKLVLQGNLNQIKSSSGQPRTIIIKNPQGQTVKKIQGTDDALLEKQVAEQLEAINRAASQQSQTMTFKSQTKRYARKTLTESTKLALQNKAQMVLNTSPTITKSSGAIPPLAPISPIKKTESQPPLPSPTKVSVSANKPLPSKLPATTPMPAKEAEKPAAAEKAAEPKRAPHQLVIQDALGNQTTIVEGQILALPSETVDGQPQSYMLVTVDETGNLTPLNNEALMSLDPNLVGDLGANMVLQVDQGTPSTETKEAVPSPSPAKVEEVVPEMVETEIVPPPEPVVEEKLSCEPVPEIPESIAQPAADPSQMQAVACAINNGETNQQLIITGDPIATQKFLESLTEGNADLANLLANAEGNILIHAEGQQILINTDSDNQMLLTLNSESSMNSMEGGEGSGNPIFSSQAPKNQDILAAALADTDVFQQESSVVPSSKVPSSQLSPGGPLYPINVNNVLETSSMSSPIMTPLEVPSTNSKKIDDTDILSQVPKNVDLPITITDPNIAQTVAHQQVTLMSDELHTNLELPLAISDVAVTSAGMNSPSFGYSLPNLDDSVDMQKPFTSSISMPLLTEEPEDVVTTSSVSVSATLPSDIIEKPMEKPETNDVPVSQDEDAKTKDELSSKTESSSLIKQYLLATSGLSAINNQMCSSLSEPPPDMFDFTIDQSFEKLEKSVTSSTDEEYVSNIESEKSDEKVESEISTPNTSSEINSPSTTSTDSCEIPVQPDIVTDMKSAENSNSKDSEI